MYKKFSNYATNALITHEIVKKNDRELYEYSFEVFISTAAILLTMLILSIVFDKELFSLLFVMGFAITRKVSGGYHAKNHRNCYFATIVNYILFILIITKIQYDVIHLLQYALLMLSTILISLFAPVEDLNKPLNADEKRKYRSRSIIFILTTDIILFFFIFHKFFQYEVLSLIIGVFSVAFYLILGKTKLFLKRRCYNEKFFKSNG